MNRPYTIVHMYTSIDGRINGKFFGQQDRKESGDYYDNKIFNVGDALAMGRVTTAAALGGHTPDLAGFDLAGEESYIVTGEKYCLVFDRMGKCSYPISTYTYGTATAQFVAVVSSRCDKRYLSYLRSVHVAYIVADTTKEALEKAYDLFGIRTVVVGGGAAIDGGFLTEEVLDEISLVVAPYVEGDESKKTAFSVSDFVPTKFRFEKATPFADGGVELIFKRG